MLIPTLIINHIHHKPHFYYYPPPPTLTNPKSSSYILPIKEEERKFRWDRFSGDEVGVGSSGSTPRPGSKRPADHPGLTELGL